MSVKQDLIMHKDDYTVFDKLAAESRKNKSCGPLGWVKVYFDSKLDANKNIISGNLHHEGSNLVVANGRSFVAQKIFNLAGTPDYRNYTLTHFAVGAGGATVSDETVTLTGPYICDTGLTKPIKLSGTYIEEPSGIIGSPNTLYSYEGAVKPITTDGTIVIEDETFENTSGGATCTYGTKVKCTCVIPAGEPTGLVAGQSVPISEAGLYLVSGSTAKMFAHICFAPKWKELN